jgi:hypothetical protein
MDTRMSFSDPARQVARDLRLHAGNLAFFEDTRDDWTCQ